MNPVKYQDLILDAIDQLRHRKARPDAERIYNALFRRHAISCTEARHALEQCVETGVVLRVAYKGNISYRNAAKKFSHLKRDSQGEVIRMPGKPRRKFTALLTAAFAELVMQDPDYLEDGVPPNELIKTILSKDSVRYTKRYASILLEKEVETGGLIKMENGYFLVGPNNNDRCQTESMEIIHNELPGNPSKLKRKPDRKEEVKKDHFMDTSNSDDKKIDNPRVGGRQKLHLQKVKKVFDPSDNNAPRKRGRPPSTASTKHSTDKQCRNSDSDSRPDSRLSQNGRELGGVCSVCHTQNKKANDRLISCRECSNKAHASCLNGDDMMLKLYPDNTWQCPHCKTCVICYETATAGSLVVCSICADGYHMGCHQPAIVEKIKNDSKWLCYNCQMPQQLAVDRIQIGFNMDLKLSSNNDEIESNSNEQSRASSPSNYLSLPPSPTPPTLSPQMVNSDGRNSPSSISDTKSEVDTIDIKQEILHMDEEVDENIDLTIPDASNWTPDEVYQYFAQYFPQEAIVFKEQEIDGHSLLLMKRMDVLKGLALRLGPALKIYRHVLKLQYRRDDPKLYWA